MLVAHKETPEERALFVYVKERKFGTGCVERWAEEQDALIAHGRTLLEPTARTLGVRPFLFGDEPTLADAALYGNLAMLAAAEATLVGRFGDVFLTFMGRLERCWRTSSAQSRTR